jgi:hypothetical protein
VRGRCPRPLDEWAERRIQSSEGRGESCRAGTLVRPRREASRAQARRRRPCARPRRRPSRRLRSEEYHAADPRDVVEDEGTATGGPLEQHSTGRCPRSAERTNATSAATMANALRGRLMVGRLTLDQVVKVRVLAPQLRKAPLMRGFLLPERALTRRLQIRLCPFAPNRRRE